MRVRGFENMRSNTAGASRAVALFAALAFALCLAPSVALGQGLPSADELDEEPEDEEVELDEVADDEEDGAGADEDAADEEGVAREGDTGDSDKTVEESEQDDSSSDGAEEGEASADGENTVREQGDESAGHPWRQNLVDAGVNLEGARGFQHMTSAKSGEPNTYHVGFLGHFAAGSDFIRYQDYNEFVAGNLVVEATILEYLSANVGMQATNNVNSFGRPQAMLSQGDAHLGVRGHLNPQPGFHLASDVTAFVPTGFTTSGLDFSAASVRPRLLLSAEFEELVPPIDDYAIPLAVHFNAGYRLDNSSELLFEGQSIDRVERFAHDIRSYDAVEFGLGVEYGFPYVSPFVSWKLDVPVNPDEGVCGDAALPCASDAGFYGFPNILSVGARVEPVDNLGLTAGVDIGLTSEDVAGLPVTPPWQAMLGASWTIDPTPGIDTRTRSRGGQDDDDSDAYVIGTIVDADTEEPVRDAIVRYVEPEGKTPQATDEEGSFRSYRFETDGEVLLEVGHADYEAVEETVELDEEGEHELEIALESTIDLATIAGRVLGADGEPLSDVRVTLEGPREVKVDTDENGEFQARVEVGEYVVTANDIDHMLGGREVAVEAGDEENFDIELAESPDTMTVEIEDERIVFDDDVSFAERSASLTDESQKVLDQVASLLLEEPEIARVRIEAHVDDDGDEDDNVSLTEQQADRVRDYLVERGLDGDRFETEGVGDQEPLVPNSGDRNRERNRRVEFYILEREEDDSELRAESEESDESAESDSDGE